MSNGKVGGLQIRRRSSAASAASPKEVVSPDVAVEETAASEPSSKPTTAPKRAGIQIGRRNKAASTNSDSEATQAQPEVDADVENHEPEEAAPQSKRSAINLRSRSKTVDEQPTPEPEVVVEDEPEEVLPEPETTVLDEVETSEDEPETAVEDEEEVVVQPKRTERKSRDLGDILGNAGALDWGSNIKKRTPSSRRTFEVGQRITREETARRFRERVNSDESFGMTLNSDSEAEAALKFFEGFLKEVVLDHPFSFMGGLFTIREHRTTIRRPPTTQEHFFVPAYSTVNFSLKVNGESKSIPGRDSTDGSFEAGKFDTEEDGKFIPNPEDQKIVDLFSEQTEA